MLSADLCPLCTSDSTPICLIDAQSKWVYQRCQVCDLIFKNAQFHLQPSAERERYLQHDNQETKGYVDFLSPVSQQVQLYLAPPARGLEFGCGPEPVLARLLERQGFSMSLYDPYFFPELPQEQFAFITCTEAVEHFYQPARSFNLMNELFQPGGLVFLLTLLHDQKTDFNSWYYRKDPTHVSFYSAQTMHWLAGRFGWTVRLCRERLVVLQKQ